MTFYSIFLFGKKSTFFTFFLRGKPNVFVKIRRTFSAESKDRQRTDNGQKRTDDKKRSGMSGQPAAL